MKYILIAAIVLSAGPGSEKKSQAKKTCTYDECVSVNKARGWDSAAVSRWCSANPGKCDN
ncbi:hypothetical protein ML401_20610 [Bradyrhizobium sp. 62B]|uniref:hypothetical protein n=1 Tax=Bradyrhizobium sp. 62B TaxID=2898442 RepID=UPI002557F2C6|nr:hypothetical protein ML401_20610 [Bradyrhizobium sp. 62B]